MQNLKMSMFQCSAPKWQNKVPLFHHLFNNQILQFLFYKLKTTSDYLCKEGAGDEDLHHHSDDQLKDKQDNGGRTLLCDASETVANCGLRLQRKEESSGQGLHLHYTWGMVGGGIKLWRKGGRTQDLGFWGVNKLSRNILFPLSMFCQVFLMLFLQCKTVFLCVFLHCVLLLYSMDPFLQKARGHFLCFVSLSLHDFKTSGILNNYVLIKEKKT